MNAAVVTRRRGGSDGKRRMGPALAAGAGKKC